MQGKNARQQVQQVCDQLQTCKSELNQAISSVEKPQNRQKIQDTLSAVEKAHQAATTTLSNYQE
ncbi:EscE/YscE/SsaE family type III secretion system needle protein co-chaperone [Clostridium grantii]|uniref:Type III secretion system, E component of needle n=1 Tax=Clostridium grantii DSM 8605 TaxID=1121316 RepID=A0A1M5UQE8_9CLOT|nr:EscE/YscE/SsaE family type III secretion system needle protein co-chaperone [Clostridium grantii]SHH65058.1 Type III secretion system, E component of needle [Clostridium grantii DSM 8605]